MCPGVGSVGVVSVGVGAAAVLLVEQGPCERVQLHHRGRRVVFVVIVVVLVIVVAVLVAVVLVAGQVRHARRHRRGRAGDGEPGREAGAGARPGPGGAEPVGPAGEIVDVVTAP